MTNVETIITLDDISEFFRELKERPTKKLPSDEAHFAKLEEVFRLAGKGEKWDSRVVFQLLDHYRAAESTLRRDGGILDVDLSRVSKCIDYVRKREEVSPAILYGVVKTVLNYGIIISSPLGNETP